MEQRGLTAGPRVGQDSGIRFLLHQRIMILARPCISTKSRLRATLDQTIDPIAVEPARQHPDLNPEAAVAVPDMAETDDPDPWRL